MNKLRSSAITQGVQRSPNRSMLRAVGFNDEDFNKPIIGVANGYSTITPCNMGLNKLALKAEESIKRSGGMPQMFGTITVSDGISMGTEGMKYSLVSREVIADSIETACNAQSMDGVLAIGGCDKNMPGAMIAIARMNIPSIFIYGGTIKPGKLHGEDLTVVSAFEAVGQLNWELLRMLFFHQNQNLHLEHWGQKPLMKFVLNSPAIQEQFWVKSWGQE